MLTSSSTTEDRCSRKLEKKSSFSVGSRRVTRGLASRASCAARGAAVVGGGVHRLRRLGFLVPRHPFSCVLGEVPALVRSRLEARLAACSGPCAGSQRAGDRWDEGVYSKRLESGWGSRRRAGLVAVRHPAAVTAAAALRLQFRREGETVCCVSHVVSEPSFRVCSWLSVSMGPAVA